MKKYTIKKSGATIISLVILLIMSSLQYSKAQYWSGLAGGMSGGSGSMGVYATISYNNYLIAAGDFQYAGGVPANNIAAWNGSRWIALGAGLNGRVEALAMYKGMLYAGGSFLFAGNTEVNFIARFNGKRWLPVSSGMKSTVKALTVYNNELIAGGYFSPANGSPYNYIAKWNGDKWTALGAGVSGGTQGQVMALTVHGTDLIAGGFFTSAGGVTCNHVAKWNGTAWSGIGSGAENGVSGIVYALTPFNGELAVGGLFLSAGTLPVHHIAKWNGAAWSTMGDGFSDNSGTYGVMSLGVYHNELIAGGGFTKSGTMPMSSISKWNGSQWSSLGSGVGNGGFSSNWVFCQAVHKNELVVGGIFNSAGSVNSAYKAKWYAPAPPVAFAANASSVNNVMEKTKAIKVYPTNVTDIVHLSAAAAISKAAVTVTGVNGIVVYNRTMAISNNTIADLSFLKPGMYILTITDGNQKQVFKIIKQ